MNLPISRDLSPDSDPRLHGVECWNHEGVENVGAHALNPELRDGGEKRVAMSDQLSGSYVKLGRRPTGRRHFQETLECPVSCVISLLYGAEKQQLVALPDTAAEERNRGPISLHGLVNSFYQGQPFPPAGLLSVAKRQGCEIARGDDRCDRRDRLNPSGCNLAVQALRSDNAGHQADHQHQDDARPDLHPFAHANDVRTGAAGRQ